MSNIRIIKSGSKENLVKVNKELYDKCVFDPTLSCKGKGIFIIMLLEPEKIYTECDFITPLDKIDSVTSGIKELLKHGYIGKIKDGYIVKGLFKVKNYSKNSGYVYVISDNYNNYKIGLAKNVAKRLKTFRTSMAYEPTIIKILHCNDMYETEKKLHLKFNNKRLNGEWFKLNDDDIAYLRSLDGDVSA